MIDEDLLYLCPTMLLEILGFLDFAPTDVLDILLVAFFIYFGFHWIKDSSALNIFVAIILLILLRSVVALLDMKLMSALMGAIIDVGVLAIIIIFQPEIRHFLTRIGSRSWLFKMKNKHLADTDVNEIVEACMVMSEQKTGALIVIPHKTPLQNIVETGDFVDAIVSRRLLMNLFFKNSPLHDGAVIISKDRIVAARCTLPITERTDIPPQFGMRHKAAIGISEESDAEVIVVSEETGGISHIREGKITKVNGKNELKNLLLNDRYKAGE